jgi:hypothetical protein
MLDFKLKRVPVDWTGQPKGYLRTSYNALVKVFGEPNVKSGDGKCHAIWNIEIENGFFLLIYDWKEYEKKVEDVTEWTTVFKQSEAEIILQFIKEIKEKL